MRGYHELAMKVAVAVCAWCLMAVPVRGASVIFDVSGTARVRTEDSPEGVTEKTIPITFPGTGFVEVTGGANAHGEIRYDFNDDRLIFDMAANASRFGPGLAEGKGKFKNTIPALYTLTVQTQFYGNEFYGEVDSNRVGFVYDFMRPEMPGTKHLSGTLEPGEHEFTAFTIAGIDRFTPLSADGSVRLDLVAIPLPPALLPGALVMGAVALRM